MSSLYLCVNPDTCESWDMVLTTNAHVCEQVRLKRSTDEEKILYAQMWRSTLITLPRHKIYDICTGIFLSLTLASRVCYLPLMLFIIADEARARGNI